MLKSQTKNQELQILFVTKCFGNQVSYMLKIISYWETNNTVTTVWIICKQGGMEFKIRTLWEILMADPPEFTRLLADATQRGRACDLRMNDEVFSSILSIFLPVPGGKTES